ncbi:MAG: hypothetical protein E5Y58_09515 [Mesorhizobium sp.]|nr:MAG: hypothetical protein E5Y58_09515 [Mesorhizobium sp.]
MGSDGIERIERYPGTEPIHRNILLVFLLAIPALVWVSTIWKQSQISFASNPPLGTIFPRQFQQVAHDARLAEIGWGNSGRRVAAGYVAVLGDLQSFFPRPTGPALAKLFARIGRMTDLICLVIPYP